MRAELNCDILCFYYLVCVILRVRGVCDANVVALWVALVPVEGTGLLFLGCRLYLKMQGSDQSLWNVTLSN